MSNLKQLREEPDFGYTHFNDRENDLKKLKWNYKTSDYAYDSTQGNQINIVTMEITALFNNVTVGTLLLGARKSSVKVGMIHIDPKFKGTGLGQILYDKGIEWAKKEGYKSFESGTVRLGPGEKAWQRIMKRYPVRKLYTGQFAIDLNDIPLTEDHHDENGFWVGEVGGASGILPICVKTRRICLAWRSDEVHQGSCWGTIGGAIQSGMSAEESARIE